MTYFVLLLQLETINKSHKYTLKKDEGTYSCPYILKIQSYISLSVKYISFSYRFRKKNILDIKITNTTWNMFRLMINNRFKTCFTANGETSFVSFKTLHTSLMWKYLANALIEEKD